MKEKVNTGYESGSGRFSIVLNDTLSHGGCTEDTRAKWLLSNLDGKCCKADCDGLLTNPRFLRQDHSLLEPVCWSTKSVKYRFFDLLITFLISRRSFLYCSIKGWLRIRLARVNSLSRSLILSRSWDVSHGIERFEIRLVTSGACEFRTPQFS